VVIFAGAYPFFFASLQVPPTILGVLYDGSGDSAYFYTDFPSRLYRANLSLVDNPDASGQYAISQSSDKANVDNVAAATFGLLDKNPNTRRAIISGYGKIFIIDLVFFGVSVPDSYIPPIPGWLATTGQLWFDSASNSSIAWFALSGTPTTLARINIDTLNTTSTQLPFGEVISSSLINDSLALFVSQTSQVAIVNLMDENPISAVLTNFTFLTDTELNSTYTRVTAVTYDPVRYLFRKRKLC